MRENIPYGGMSARVIKLFGSQRILATAIGVSSGTVSHWAKLGFIPEQYRAEILQKAKARGIPLTPLHFIEYLMPLAA